MLYEIYNTLRGFKKDKLYLLARTGVVGNIIC